ncbi:MAG: RNA 3'-terminal phosphate cyclase [Pirellulaceae bacterium]|nr:RNA 3'-terminal phosphate cyclase [Pirellulaceae bacterium]
MSELISIDGSQGEGGGQMIRSALSLAMITGRAFEIQNIRAKREKPGLLRQHLTAVNAARTVCNGQVTGAELGSREMIFAPCEIHPRHFRFDIGSAGSTTLVAQTLIPALMIASGPSTIEITGGTHNQAAPPYHYLESSYLPIVSRMGPKFTPDLLRWGFYPAGGGHIRIDIDPQQNLRGIEIDKWLATPTAKVTAVVSQLPESIAEREVQLIRRRAGWNPEQCHVKNITTSPGPGNVVMIELRGPQVTEIFTGFGRRGIRAEQVALGAWEEAKEYLASAAPVGEHLCDQLLLPMSIAASQGQTSRILTGLLSQHSQTQIDLIRKFLDVAIQITNRGPRQIQIDTFASTQSNPVPS